MRRLRPEHTGIYDRGAHDWLPGGLDLLLSALFVAVVVAYPTYGASLSQALPWVAAMAPGMAVLGTGVAVARRGTVGWLEGLAVVASCLVWRIVGNIEPMLPQAIHQGAEFPAALHRLLPLAGDFIRAGAVRAAAPGLPLALAGIAGPVLMALGFAFLFLAPLHLAIGFTAGRMGREVLRPIGERLIWAVVGAALLAGLWPALARGDWPAAGRVFVKVVWG